MEEMKHQPVSMGNETAQAFQLVWVTAMLITTYWLKWAPDLVTCGCHWVPPHWLIFPPFACFMHYPKIRKSQPVSPSSLSSCSMGYEGQKSMTFKSVLTAAHVWVTEEQTGPYACHLGLTRIWTIVLNVGWNYFHHKFRWSNLMPCF